MKPLRTPAWKLQFHCAFRRAVCCAFVFAPISIAIVHAQVAGTAPGTFAPGSRELFSINFAQEPLGQIPKSLEVLSGTMEMVEKDGMRMLRASQRSEFLITLPNLQRLPEKFTLEIDLVTRAAGYNNEEVGFEGTPTPYQNAASARISWYQGMVSIAGGSETPPEPKSMPDEIRALIEGQMAEIRAQFDGDNFRLYTNGRELYNLTAMKFVRGRVLRVALGGNDADRYAVHLAKLRIADATTTSPIIAQQQSGLMSTSSNLMQPTSTATAPAITGLTVTLNANGAPVVRWNPLTVAATYFVVRWNANDPACCNAMSPPGIPLTSPVWQDVVLPLSGTYIYRVIAKTATVTVEAQTQFMYGGAYAPTTAGATIPLPSGPAISTEPRLVTSTTSTTTNVPTAPTTTSTINVPTSPALSTEPKLVTTTVTGVTDIAPTFGGATMTPPKISDGSGGGGGGSYDPPNPASTPSGGSGLVPQFQIVMTGATVMKPTKDDILNIDGHGDELQAAAAVVVWDRATGQMRSYGFVQTCEYGEVGLVTAPANRIQAGSASIRGGLAAGDRVPPDYDPSNTNALSPAGDRFPLLLWQGELTPGVEAVIVAPSLWERDTIHLHFDRYKANWQTVSPAALMNLSTVKDQLSTPTLTYASVLPNPLTIAAPPTPTFTGPPTNGYKIADVAFGPSSDRPIGMRSMIGVFLYEERITVITREKLSTLSVGQGMTIAVPFKEATEIFLQGDFTLYLRVQRTQ